MGLIITMANSKKHTYRLAQLLDKSHGLPLQPPLEPISHNDHNNRLKFHSQCLINKVKMPYTYRSTGIKKNRAADEKVSNSLT